MFLYFFLAGLFFLTLLFGKIIEKVRIPWIFAALFLGFGLSIYNPFSVITESESFDFLAQLGMYFLLFIIGFDLNIREIVRHHRFIFKLSTLVIFMETLIGFFFIHFVFHTPWLISLLVATSFATVGEAVLLPILDEFKLTNTKFGQVLLGVGAFDDIFEIVTILFMSILLSHSADHSVLSIGWSFGVFALLFFVPLLLFWIHKRIPFHFQFKNISILFLMALGVLFLFVGTGNFVEAGSLGALLAGVSLKTFLSRHQIMVLEQEIRTIAYGFFIPIFFLSVGLDVDIHYLFTAPLLIIALLLISNITKIGTSFLAARKELGARKSILMGIGLCAKFSTSIVIITLLFEKDFISLELFSVLVGAMVLSKFIIPFGFAALLQKWNIEFKTEKKA